MSLKSFHLSLLNILTRFKFRFELPLSVLDPHLSCLTGPKNKVFTVTLFYRSGHYKYHYYFLPWGLKPQKKIIFTTNVA